MVTRHRIVPALLVVASFLVVGALPSMAADDTEVRAAIEARLQKKDLLRDADVAVAVRDGEATLSGIVTNLPLKREIEKQAHSVP